MKRLLILALLGILGVAGLSYSQEIPDGLKTIMNQLQNDPDVNFGFNEAKETRFIASEVQFKDWFVGLPIEIYNYNGPALDTATEDNNIMDLIKSSNIWRIPVRINDNYSYYVKVWFENGQFKTIGSGEDVSGFGVVWDKVRKKYPENTGIQPIVVDVRDHIFIHFPHIKNNKKTFHLNRFSTGNDKRSLTNPGTLDSLKDNKEIIKLLIESSKKAKEESRKYLENHPNPPFNKSGGSR